MRNKIVAATIAGLATAPAVANAAEVNWFGFTQITAHNNTQDPNGGQGGIAFGADRIRIGYKAKFDSGAHSKLQVDFNRPPASRGGLNRIIKDAVVGYDFGMVDIQAGNRKMPLGMDFTTSGKKLDIVKRGMEKDFVLERAAGAFAFINAGSLGIDLAVANPAYRSGSLRGGRNPGGANGVQNTAVPGEDYSYAVRVRGDMGKILSAQAAYGTSTTSSNAGNAEDYTVFDLGVQSKPMPGLTLKAEYLQGSAVGHVDGRDQTVWFAHGGYEFMPMVEGVIRHYNSNAEGPNGGDDTLSETWIGGNIFLNPEKHHEARIQLNYVMPGGDTDGALGGAHRTMTATDDNGEATGTFWAMFQTAF